MPFIQRKKMQTLKHCLTVLLSIAFLCCVLSPAIAADHSTAANTCSFTIENAYGRTPLSSVRFSIYLVAERASNGTFTLLPDYKKSGVSIANLKKASEWNQAAQDFANWTEKRSLPFAAQQTTDAKGHTTFSALSEGLYLVIGDPVSSGKYCYTSAPFLVSLPNWDAIQQHWISSVTVEPKNTATSSGDSGSDDPSTPTQPTEPSNPVTPVQPVQPTQPVTPVTPTNPSEPQTPSSKEHPEHHITIDDPNVPLHHGDSYPDGITPSTDATSTPEGSDTSGSIGQPQTGDTTAVFRWIALLLFACAGLVSLFLKRDS